MVAALSVTHGFLPPHPGPTAIAGEYGANIGEVLLYGFIVAVPTVLIAGPLKNRSCIICEKRQYCITRHTKNI